MRHLDIVLALRERFHHGGQIDDRTSKLAAEQARKGDSDRQHDGATHDQRPQADLEGKGMGGLAGHQPFLRGGLELTQRGKDLHQADLVTGIADIGLHARRIALANTLDQNIGLVRAPVLGKRRRLAGKIALRGGGKDFLELRGRGDRTLLSVVILFEIFLVGSYRETAHLAVHPQQLHLHLGSLLHDRIVPIDIIGGTGDITVRHEDDDGHHQGGDQDARERQCDLLGYLQIGEHLETIPGWRPSTWDNAISPGQLRRMNSLILGCVFRNLRDY